MQRRLIYATAGALSFLAMIGIGAVRADDGKIDDPKPGVARFVRTLSAKAPGVGRVQASTALLSPEVALPGGDRPQTW